MTIAQRNPEQTPIAVHVVPLEIDDERALAVLDRDPDVIETGEHPPFLYLAAVFSKIYATGMTRCQAEVTS